MPRRPRRNERPTRPLAFADAMRPLAPEACALRPVEALVARNTFQYYTELAPDRQRDPVVAWPVLDQVLRQLRRNGYLRHDPRRYLVLDVVDASGLVIQDYPVTVDGLMWLIAEYQLAPQP